MITVACVLWWGDFKNRQYSPEHVERLMRQVEGRLSQPYRFLCLTNTDVPCERVPLVTGWPGWWAKLELFRPGLFKGQRDRILYLDLDVTVTGPLDELADFPAPFVICKNFLSMGFNSSVMAWDHGAVSDLYTDFKASMMQRPGGDQAWIFRKHPEAAKFPRAWCRSYRLDEATGQRSAGMRVRIYHGEVKPWDLEVA